MGGKGIPFPSLLSPISVLLCFISHWLCSQISRYFATYEQLHFVYCVNDEDICRFMRNCSLNNTTILPRPVMGSGVWWQPCQWDHKGVEIFAVRSMVVLRTISVVCCVVGSSSITLHGHITRLLRLYTVHTLCCVSPPHSTPFGVDGAVQSFRWA